MEEVNSLRLRKVVILEKIDMFTFWVKDLVNGNETEMFMSGKQAMNYHSLVKPGREVYALKSHKEEIRRYRLEVKPDNEQTILDKYLKNLDKI